MPRVGLSRPIVVAEAARIADEIGWEALTLAAVATRLGVRLPSLYKHIDGRDALRTHVAVDALRGLAIELSAATVGKSGREAITALADAYRGFAARRPGAYAATIAAPDPGNAEHVAAATAVLQVALSVLEGFGLTGADAIDALRGLRALMHGFVAIEAAGGYRMPEDLDHSYHRLVASFGVALSTWQAETGPAVTGAAQVSAR